MRKRTLSLLLASTLSLSLAFPALAAESDTAPRLYPVLTESEITYVPVSYTHLDVYKRQEHKSIFNISLPQVMPVQPLKSLGSVPFVIVKLHHCGGIPCTAQSILQCGSLQKSGRSLLLQLQDFNNCRDAPAGKFPA